MIMPKGFLFRSPNGRGYVSLGEGEQIASDGWIPALHSWMTNPDGMVKLTAVVTMANYAERFYVITRVKRTFDDIDLEGRKMKTANTKWANTAWVDCSEMHLGKAALMLRCVHGVRGDVTCNIDDYLAAGYAGERCKYLDEDLGFTFFIVPEANCPRGIIWGRTPGKPNPVADENVKLRERVRVLETLLANYARDVRDVL